MAAEAKKCRVILDELVKTAYHLRVGFLPKPAACRLLFCLYLVPSYCRHAVFLKSS